jgi:hypothetical protein
MIGNFVELCSVYEFLVFGWLGGSDYLVHTYGIIWPPDVKKLCMQVATLSELITLLESRTTFLDVLELIRAIHGWLTQRRSSTAEVTTEEDVSKLWKNPDTI